MKILKTPHEMQAQVEQWRLAGHSIGLVPTMGALHAGHISLVQRSLQHNSKTVVSIFVNPTQFRPGEDFQQYPRPFERDCELLQKQQCDVIFAPEAEAMYHGDTRAFVEVEGVSLRWEAEARPGHFRGVATVVAKLFNLVRAHHAYFGEKDFQQLKVVEAMVHGLNFETEIVPCPTIREDDGLALSSRNAYLTAEQRAAAPVIYRALKTARDKARNGYYDVNDLTAAIHGVLQTEPILKPEYAAIVDDEKLEPLERLTNATSARAIIAVRAGNTRLIDNIAIGTR